LNFAHWQFGDYLDIGAWNLVVLRLSLPLFMFGVLTDHPDYPFSFYNLTLVADFFDGCPDLHLLYPVFTKLNSPFAPLLPKRGEEALIISPEI